MNDSATTTRRTVTYGTTAPLEQEIFASCPNISWSAPSPETLLVNHASLLCGLTTLARDLAAGLLAKPVSSRRDDPPRPGHPAALPRLRGVRQFASCKSEEKGGWGLQERYTKTRYAAEEPDQPRAGDRVEVTASNLWLCLSLIRDLVNPGSFSPQS